MSGQGPVVGRAVYEIVLDQTPFNQGLAQAKQTAAAQALQIFNTLNTAGQGLGGPGIQQGAAKFTQQLTQVQQTAQQATAQINQGLGQVGATLGGPTAQQGVQRLTQGLQQAQQQSNLLANSFSAFGERITQGLTVGIGIGLADTLLEAPRAALDGFKALVSDTADTILSYGTSLQTTSAQLRAFTGSQESTNVALALARSEMAAGRGSFSELASTIAGLEPAAKTSGAAISDLLHLAERLAASNPEQGLTGAGFALREASAGQFRSVQNRFNIPLNVINDLKAQGVPNIEIVSRALDQMGISFDLVTNRANNVDMLRVRLSGLKEILEGTAGAPLFTAYQQGLEGLVHALSSDQVTQGAQHIAAGIQDILDHLAATFGREQYRQAIVDLGSNLLAMAENSAQAAKSLGTLADVLGVVVGLGTRLDANPLHRLAEAAGAVVDALHGGAVVQSLAASIFGEAGPLAIVNGLLQVGTGLDFVSQEIDNLATRTDKLGTIAKHLQDLRNGINAAASTPTPIGAAAIQQSPATTPATEAQFDATYQTQIHAANEAARQAANAYFQTFTSDTADQFKGATQLFTDIFTAMRGGTLDANDQEQLAQGYALIARALGEIQQSGQPSAEVIKELNAQFGIGATAVIQYLNGVEQLTDAQQRLAAATTKTAELQNAVDIAQTVFNVAKQQDEQAVAAAQAQVTAAQDAARYHQEQAQAQTQALQNQLSDLNDEADAVARGYQSTLDGLNQQLSLMQRDAQAAEAALAAQVTAAQAAVNAAQDAATQHAAAYQAVLDGTTDIFRAQNEQLDEQTQKILANGEAQIGVQRRLKDAENERVTALTRQQDRGLLAIDTQIQQVREGSAPDRTRQLAALARQRQAFLESTQPNIDLERERAKVAQDDFDQRAQAIQRQATQQQTADKQAVDAATARLTAVQQEAQARQDADKAAQQALQDQIAGVQQEAKDSAAMYDARKRGVQAEITEVQRRADITAKSDKQAVDDATAYAKLVKDAADTDIGAHQKVLDDAKSALKVAQDNVTEIKNQLQPLKDNNEQLIQRNKLELDYLNMLRAAGGLPPLSGAPTAENPTPGVAPNTAPTPIPRPPATAPEGPGGEPGVAPPPPPPSTRPGTGPTASERQLTAFGSGPARLLPPAQPTVATAPSLAERGLLTVQPAAAVAPRGGDLIINNPIVADVVGLAQFRREVQAALDQHTQQQGVVLRNVLGAGSGAGSLLG